MATNRNITAADSVVMLSIEGLYNTPQQLQGYSAEDIFDADEIEVGEFMQGIDGTLSAGFIYTPIPWKITLMADSASNDIFDQWYAAEQNARAKFLATVNVALPSLGRKWAMLNGGLRNYKPMPPGKKVLQPRSFTMLFERLSPATS